MGDYSKTPEYYQKTCKIEEITLPHSHPHLAISHSNIGGVYNNNGQYSRALQSNENSIEIR